MYGLRLILPLPVLNRGCHESYAWVVASVPGLVVRSDNGVVVIDMDGDGYEQTGWTLLYLHIATNGQGASWHLG
jgi:hypothetical protein